MLVLLKGSGPAIRRIFGQNPTWLTHPSRPRPFEAYPSRPVILGRISRLVRLF